MRYTLASLLILVVGIGTADASIRIHGTIVDKTNNEPAAGQTISVFDSNGKILMGSYADADGKFDLNIPDTAAKIETSGVDLESKTFSPRELTGQTIYLTQKVYNLDEVVVTASRPSSGGDGCDNDANDRIAPELALCSAHAYNIGLSENPSGADKQLMKEIIALKTTVIAQQMNKQYEYMDSMIRRFKTQLEKAVLTTKMQAAGATK